MNARVGQQVGVGIGFESRQIADLIGSNHVAAGGCHGAGLGIIDGAQAVLFAPVVFQQPDAGQARALLAGQQVDAVGINRQRAANAAPAGLEHAAPVLEAVAHQPPGRDGGDGFVKVLHLDSVQRNVGDKAIGADLGHLDPVAHAQHVVAAQLHASDKGQDGVLEHQHQHCRHGAQTRQQQQRRAVEQGGHNHHRRKNADQQLAQLHIAFDGMGLRGLARFITVMGVVHGVEQIAQRPRQVVDGEADGQIGDQRNPALVQKGHAADAKLHDQRGHDLGQTAQHVVVQQDAGPVGLERVAHMAKQAQHHPLGDQSGHGGHQRQQAEGSQGLHGRVPFRDVGSPLGKQQKLLSQIFSEGAAQKALQPAGSGARRKTVGRSMAG